MTATKQQEPGRIARPARPSDEAIARMDRSQRRRMARYCLDGWTPGLLRALAAAGRRAGMPVESDAATLEAYLTAQDLAGGQ